MDYKSQILTEIETLPTSLLPDVLGYIQALQPQVRVSKPVLTKKTQSPSDISNSVIIYTDGACTGNPGAGGYGAVIINGDRREELAKGYKRTTNNRMEMMAAIAALQSLADKSQVKIHSDSKYLVDAMGKGWAKKWQANGWRRNAKEMAKNPDLWQILLDLCKLHDVEFIWVKAHAGIAENERCDRLAVAAAHQSNLSEDDGYVNGG
ncbi:ribonuclease H [Chondrocystis sp. NIES-4102]|nr:ribonuclease H [Chondrocystis sp. NIES-4102]